MIDTKIKPDSIQSGRDYAIAKFSFKVLPNKPEKIPSGHCYILINKVRDIIIFCFLKSDLEFAIGLDIYFEKVIQTNNLPFQQPDPWNTEYERKVFPMEIVFDQTMQDYINSFKLDGSVPININGVAYCDGIKSIVLSIKIMQDDTKNLLEYINQ